MTISYRWLSEYLPQTVRPEELSNILTSIGLEVESLENFENFKGGLAGLVVGEVLEVIPHPNADKLKLTKVAVGGDRPLNIVCGASNVAVGQKVVVAQEGTTIYPKNGSPITAMPEDGSSYKRGDVIGDARVAYVGSGTGFSPRGIIANQTYYFKVFAFNGQDGFENYRIVSPASETVTTPGQNIGNYYQGINSNAPSLILDLQMLVYPHTQLTYFSYKTTMMNEFEVRDTTDGQSYVTCAYSGERKVFNDPFDWTPLGYSREHTFSHSWMPTFPAKSPCRPSRRSFSRHA